ncbi:hypothetical protein [uncultured Mycolicibacterium sp.]|uniref:hypothetical protein n=1 Tax=uncultured Mycolicibacterium sp. TaxID=2320817 RepID=UPI00260E19B4|nr:hypothetical protein [uncultured Mycolicibacterium sp.]
MHSRRGVVAALALAVGLTAACANHIEGRPIAIPPSGTEPKVSMPRPSRLPAAPPSANARVPGGDVQVLTPREGGYVFIETKSGLTRCQLNTEYVGCETRFVDPPSIDGHPATGVRLDADGQVRWVVGNLGAIPAVTLDYQRYSAVGWTIDARPDGTRFTNDRTGHGMEIATEGVHTF